MKEKKFCAKESHSKKYGHFKISCCYLEFTHCQELELANYRTQKHEFTEHECHSSLIG